MWISIFFYVLVAFLTTSTVWLVFLFISYKSSLRTLQEMEYGDSRYWAYKTLEYQMFDMKLSYDELFKEYYKTKDTLQNHEKLKETYLEAGYLLSFFMQQDEETDSNSFYTREFHYLELLHYILLNWGYEKFSKKKLRALSSNF